MKEFKAVLKYIMQQATAEGQPLEAFDSDSIYTHAEANMTYPAILIKADEESILAANADNYALVEGSAVVYVIPKREEEGDWEAAEEFTEIQAKNVRGALLAAERLITPSYTDGFLEPGQRQVSVGRITYGDFLFNDTNWSPGAMIEIAAKYYGTI